MPTKRLDLGQMMIEGIGAFARALGRSFVADGALMSAVLFPLLSKLGSPNAQVSSRPFLGPRSDFRSGVHLVGITVDPTRKCNPASSMKAFAFSPRKQGSSAGKFRFLGGSNLGKCSWGANSNHPVPRIFAGPFGALTCYSVTHRKSEERVKFTCFDPLQGLCERAGSADLVNTLQMRVESNSLRESLQRRASRFSAKHAFSTSGHHIISMPTGSVLSSFKLPLLRNGLKLYARRPQVSASGDLALQSNDLRAWLVTSPETICCGAR